MATPSDFGSRGEAPTHPELLDWLAGELIRNGWRLKPIHRLIMTSAVYREGSERAGVLGQALFLALTAKPEDSSPTARGLFVREQFLCQHVPDPPAGVNTNLPPVTEAKPQTNRDRMSEHVSNPTCATCHQLIDQIGFGLEKFDAVGARRDKFTLQFFTGRGEGRQRLSKSIDLDVTGV